MQPMGDDVLNPEFWRNRLLKAVASEQIHHAVFRAPRELWDEINAKHRKLLRDRIMPTTSILDCGCGWGRLLTLLPSNWRGRYLGVDLSPDFIEIAQRDRPERDFLVQDLRHPLSDLIGRFDLAVLTSVRPMIRRECGEEVWQTIERNIRRVVDRILYLEYDPNDPGSLE